MDVEDVVDVDVGLLEGVFFGGVWKKIIMIS